LTKKQEQQLEKGGVTGDKYRSVLASVVNADSEIDSKQTEFAGIQEQIEVITKSIADTDNAEKSLGTSLKQEILHETSDVLTAARGRYAPASGAARQLSETGDRIKQ